VLEAMLPGFSDSTCWVTARNVAGSRAIDWPNPAADPANPTLSG
jgi:hypothetical protein